MLATLPLKALVQRRSRAKSRGVEKKPGYVVPVSGVFLAVIS